jgi:hypothetical protein
VRSAAIRVLAKEREECAGTPFRPPRSRRHGLEAASLWRSVSG